MRVDVSCKYMEHSEFIDEVLDKNLDKVEKRVLMFKGGEAVHVSVHLEKNPHREEFSCRVHIYLPSRVIKAEEKSVKIPTAINKTFAALVKQLSKVKVKVEKHLSSRNMERISQIVAGDNFQ